MYIDEMSHFDRERIPERVVHAKGAGKGQQVGVVIVTGSSGGVVWWEDTMLRKKLIKTENDQYLNFIKDTPPPPPTHTYTHTVFCWGGGEMYLIEFRYRSFQHNILLLWRHIYSTVLGSVETKQHSE